MDKDKPESSRQGPVWCLSAWSFICIHRTSGEPNWPFGSIADVVVAHHASHSCGKRPAGCWAVEKALGVRRGTELFLMTKNKKNSVTILKNWQK
jgi:hypothetical protein